VAKRPLVSVLRAKQEPHHDSIASETHRSKLQYVQGCSSKRRMDLLLLPRLSKALGRSRSKQVDAFHVKNNKWLLGSLGVRATFAPANSYWCVSTSHSLVQTQLVDVHTAVLDLVQVQLAVWRVMGDG
jgi:hypothetical protein